MNNSSPTTTLFLDLGGVLLTNSSFVHCRKPDADIYHIALDIAQVRAAETLYIEDREMFVQVAAGLGIPAIHHVSYEDTRSQLAARGLVLAGEFVSDFA